MKQYIIFIPALIALMVAIFRSPEKALYHVYLPVLLLIPNVYLLSIGNVPAWSFSDVTIMTILVVTLFTRSGRYKFSYMDLLIVFYVGCSVYSEFSNTGPGYGRHLITDQLSTVIAPYFLAKMLIFPSGLTIPFARRIVFLMFINVILSAYEMKFTVNPYLKIFDSIFPDQNQQAIWPTSVRYGLVRIAGPFIQTILFGTLLGVAVLFNTWLMKNKFWPRISKHLPTLLRLPTLVLSKEKIIMLVLILGMICTVSRGPIIGTLLGAAFVGVGYAKYKFKSFLISSLILCAALVCAYGLYLEYSSIGKDSAVSDTQYTAAYRADLVREYSSQVMERPYWGWGSLKLMSIYGPITVDNQYLYLAITYGLVTMSGFIAIIVCTLFSLLFRGLLKCKGSREDSSLCFTFFGIYLAIALTLITVYIGMQLQPIFFILTGWINGYLASKPSAFFTSQNVEKYSNARPSQQQLA